MLQQLFPGKELLAPSDSASRRIKRSVEFVPALGAEVFFFEDDAMSHVLFQNQEVL